MGDRKLTTAELKKQADEKIQTLMEPRPVTHHVIPRTAQNARITSPNFLDGARGVDGLKFHQVSRKSIHTPGKKKKGYIPPPMNTKCSKNLNEQSAFLPSTITVPEEADLLARTADELYNQMETEIEHYDWNVEKENLDLTLEKMEEDVLNEFGPGFWHDLDTLMKQPKGTLYVEPEDRTLPDNYLTGMDVDEARPLNIPIKF